MKSRRRLKSWRRRRSVSTDSKCNVSIWTGDYGSVAAAAAAAAVEVVDPLHICPTPCFWTMYINSELPLFFTSYILVFLQWLLQNEKKEKKKKKQDLLLFSDWIQEPKRTKLCAQDHTYCKR